MTDHVLGQRFKHSRNGNVYEYHGCSTDIRASKFPMRQVHFLANPATGAVVEHMGRPVWVKRHLLRKCN